MKAEPKLEDLLPLVPSEWHIDFLNFWTTSRISKELKEAVPLYPGLQEAITLIIEDEFRRFERFCHALDMTGAEFLEKKKREKEENRK